MKSIETLRKCERRARRAWGACVAAERSARAKTTRAGYDLDKAAALLNAALMDRDIATLNAMNAKREKGDGGEGNGGDNGGDNGV